jgi:hypothetical protein
MRKSQEQQHLTKPKLQVKKKINKFSQKKSIFFYFYNLLLKIFVHTKIYYPPIIEEVLQFYSLKKLKIPEKCHKNFKLFGLLQFFIKNKNYLKSN